MFTGCSRSFQRSFLRWSLNCEGEREEGEREKRERGREGGTEECDNSLHV